MANRAFHTAETQGVRHCDLAFAVSFPSVAGTPVLGEGDAAGAYVSASRVGAGQIQITTKDPFVAVVNASGQIQLATPAGQWNIMPTTPVQNANNTWTITFTTFNGATATDIPAVAGNAVYFYLTFRNSLVKP